MIKSKVNQNRERDRKIIRDERSIELNPPTQVIYLVIIDITNYCDYFS